MDLSIIIVSWNVREKLRENLASIYSSKGDFSFEVFVVDNASVDGTVTMIKKDFSQVKVIANKDNLGFARANNLALKKATGDCLLLLNPDMRLRGDTLNNFLAWLNKSDADIAGCKLVNELGEIVSHVRRFPTLKDQLAIAMKLPHLFPGLLDKYLAKEFNYNKAAAVDSIRGSFFAIKRSAYEKIGGLDERYFVWFEEVDYCRQARKAGLTIWYTPAAVAIDYVGLGFRQINRSVKQKYFKESMLKYFAKWHGAGSVILLQCAWVLGGVIQWLADELKIKSKAKT